MNVRTAIERLLEATAAQTAIKVRIDRLRTDLHREAVTRWQADGAAPTWKAKGLGTVRLDGADADRRAKVVDASEFTSWLAQRQPAAVDARIRLHPDQLEPALEALRFAGVTVTGADLDADPHVTADILANLHLTIEGGDVYEGDQDPVTRQWETVVAHTLDNTTGELVQVPGIGAHPPAPPKLVVSLDAERKRQLLEDAIAELEVEEADERVETELAAEPSAHREPYVGTGADGARRSAEIDRSEADGYDRGDPRINERLMSAERWELQAADLEDAVATPLLSDAEAATVARFEAAPDPFARPEICPDCQEVICDADCRTAAANGWPTEAPHPLAGAEVISSGPITLEVHDVVVAPEHVAAFAEPVTQPVEDTTPAIEVDVEDLRSIGDAPQARDAARRMLAKLAANPTAWDQAKAADLHNYAQLADLGLPRGKLAKAVLHTRVLAQLAAHGIPT